MLEIFYDFVSTVVLLAVALGVVIVFEKKIISLEDKFDEWLKPIINENVALKKENCNLMADNKRLSDSNLNLWYENKQLNAKLQGKEDYKLGEYFYKKED